MTEKEGKSTLKIKTDSYCMVSDIIVVEVQTELSENSNMATGAILRYTIHKSSS